jgi:hypothetical protein
VCEFCARRIRWAYPAPSTRPRAGAKPPKPKPFDFEPDASGLFTYYEQDGKGFYGLLGKGQAAGYRAAGNSTYQAHFKTCVKASEWGKLGKAYGAKAVDR